MVKSVNHIGVAVKSLAEARPFYQETLGATFEGEEEVHDQKVRVAFMRVGDVRIELLEPTSPDSPVATFMDKRGPGIHHIAYCVDDLPARIAELKAKGIRMVDETPRAGAHHMSIAFLHPKSTHGVLTEICEPMH